jgi:hypothetical protein
VKIPYTQPLQQHIALTALRMHTAKKEKKNYKKKSPDKVIYFLEQQY